MTRRVFAVGLCLLLTACVGFPFQLYRLPATKEQTKVYLPQIIDAASSLGYKTESNETRVDVLFPDERMIVFYVDPRTEVFQLMVLSKNGRKDDPNNAAMLKDLKTKADEIWTKAVTSTGGPPPPQTIVQAN